MKHAKVIARKSQEPRTSGRDGAGAGQNGRSLRPPRYGLGVVDDGLVAGAPGVVATVVQRKCAACEDEEALQRKAVVGWPVEGRDAGPIQAAGLRGSPAALAYTGCANIHFAPGQYQPVQMKEGRIRFPSPVLQLEAGNPPVPKQDDGAAIDPFVQEMIDTADYMFLTDRNHELGWHNSLSKKAKKKPEKKRSEDEFGGVVEPVPVGQNAIDRLYESIDERLANVKFPTTKGDGFSERDDGHQYMSRSHDKNAQAAAHTAYSKGAELAQIGIDAPTDQQKILWLHFKVVLGEEGDTSALNTYDAQIVTIGGGFGAKYGQAGEVLARLPGTYKDRLYSIGIYVADDGNIKYLNTKKKKVVEGEDAWRHLRHNLDLLAYIVNLAQSDDTISQNPNPGKPLTMRDTMLKAQFEQFFANNVEVFDTKFKDGPFNTRQLAIKLHHWLPGVFPWSAIDAMPESFNSAMTWAEKRLKDKKQSKYLTQFKRMKRFEQVTSADKAKEYADKQFDR